MGGAGETTSSVLPRVRRGTWGDARTNYCTSSQVGAESELALRHHRNSSKQGKTGKKWLCWKTQCRDAGGEGCKGGMSHGSPLKRCTCASNCAFLIMHLLPELKPHVYEDGCRGRNPRLGSGRKQEPEQHGQEKPLLLLHP